VEWNGEWMQMQMPRVCERVGLHWIILSLYDDEVYLLDSSGWHGRGSKLLFGWGDESMDRHALS
jgi:hypothetical protein